MTTISFDFQIDDVDGEIFKRVDNTEAFINKYGVLHNRKLFTLKDITKNKISQGYHKFKINNKLYNLEPLLKKMFNYEISKIDCSHDVRSENVKNQIPQIKNINQIEIVDDKTIKIDNEEYKQIYNEEAYINKCGMVYLKDKKKVVNVQNYKEHRITINGNRYYLRKTIRDSFDIKPKKVKKESKAKNEVIQERIITKDKYNNHDVLKEVPEDMTQLKEYKNKQLKEGYYYSKIRFGLYRKIDCSHDVRSENTNQYYELKNKYPEFLEKYNNKRKYYNVKTKEDKQIPISLIYDDLE